MHYPEFNDKISAIKVALKSLPEPTITGGKLDGLIRAVSPDLNVREIVDIPHGPGALTEFIRRHLADAVERIGIQGVDVLYRIIGHEVESLPYSASSQIWRTFVSPNSTQHLVLNRSTQLLSVRDVPAAGGEELEIVKATLAEHDRIRFDFVDTLSTSDKAILSEYVDTDADFNSWIATLRERLPSRIPSWGHYRRRRLAELAKARIVGLNLEESLRLATLDQMKSAEMSAYAKPTRPNAPPSSTKREMTNDDDAVDATAHARRLAHAAIDLIAYDDLRSLKIPLGALLDVIRNKV